MQYAIQLVWHTSSATPHIRGQFRGAGPVSVPGPKGSGRDGGTGRIRARPDALRKWRGSNAWDGRIPGEMHGLEAVARILLSPAAMRLFSPLSSCLLLLGLLAACAPAADVPAPETEGATAAGAGVRGTQPSGTLLRATGNVNLRKGPATSFSVIDVVMKGAVVSVVTPNPKNGFYQVDYDGQIGWSSGKYYEAVGSAGSGGNGGNAGGAGTAGGGSSSGGAGGSGNSGSGGGGVGGGSSGGGGSSSTTPWVPKPKTRWHWQLTGSLQVAPGAEMVDLDLFETSASTIANVRASGQRVICYFSAGSREDWRPDASQFNASDYGNALDGWPGERWLDTRSNNVRQIMKARMALAVNKGCDGVEPDNVDGYANSSGFSLTEATQIDYNRFLAKEAHARGLSVGLKNAVDLVPDLVNDFDWALNEECLAYSECSTTQPFIAAGKAVFHVEYVDSSSQGAGKKSSVCGQPSAAGFSTLIKTWDLDAWGIACP